MLGKTIQGLFGKDKFTVNFHFKNTTAGSNEFSIHTAVILDSGRQTGGRGFVISDLAIFDADMHPQSPKTG